MKCNEKLVELLRRYSKTVSSAESCTGGLFAKMITDVSGSSDVFSEGVITYSEEAKMKYLNVPETLIQTHGVVSAEVAVAMARGIQSFSDSDYAVSFTGLAGPGGGTVDKPVGLVYAAIADREGALSFELRLDGDREAIRTEAVELVMNELCDVIISCNSQQDML